MPLTVHQKLEKLSRLFSILDPYTHEQQVITHRYAIFEATEH